MPPARRATLLDVAAAAGVSRALAGSAITGRGRVNPETRQRILDAAKTLGYAAHPIARRLRLNTAETYGIILPEIANQVPWYQHFTFGAAAEAARSNTSILLIPFSKNAEAVASLPVDGFLVPDVIRNQLMRTVLDDPRPTVVGDTVPDDLPQPDAIMILDDNAFIAELAEYLVTTGSERPALLTSTSDAGWISRVAAGYNSWTQQHQRPTLSETAASGSEHDIATAVQLLVDRGADSIITIPDPKVVYHMCRERHPGIRVAAFVDSPVLATLGVPAIDLMPRDYGASCVEKLRQIVTGDHAPMPLPRPGVIPRDQYGR